MRSSKCNDARLLVAVIGASTGMFGPVPTQKIADLLTTAQIGPQ